MFFFQSKRITSKKIHGKPIFFIIPYLTKEIVVSMVFSKGVGIYMYGLQEISYFEETVKSNVVAKLKYAFLPGETYKGML